jgi:methylmalonyl-CoA mutase
MTERDEARNGGAHGDARGERFAPVGYEEWRARVEEELRGAPFERLVSTLPGGIDVQPLYHERPWGEGDDPRGLPGTAPFVRGGRPAGEAGAWLRCARIDAPDPEAAKTALAADLRGGCDALWLELDVFPRPDAGIGGGIPISSPKALAALLREVDLERVALFLDAGVGSLDAAALVFDLLGMRRADRGRVALFLGVDPIGALAADGASTEPLEDFEPWMTALAVRCAATLPRSRAIGVSALPWHEAGATPAQELGWAVATLVRYLRRMEEAGLGAEAAAGQVELRVAVGRDLFLGIAKLRSLRLLWAKLLGVCGVVNPPPPFLHAVSSDRALARRDPFTNMLRVTTEVFAAVVGGADAITAVPYDRLLPSAGGPAGSRLGRRIARNTQHVLAEEAHVGRVADPAGGSYYLETLTEELARAAWDELRRVEAAGGIAEHLRSGRLREEAEAAWQEQRRALVAGAEPVLGVSLYPPPADERAEEADGGRRPQVSRRAEGVLAGEFVGPLPRHRLAEPFEDEGVAPPAAAGAAEKPA